MKDAPAATHPLQQKIDAVRRRIRRLTVLHAVGWTAAAVLAAALLLGLTDYFLRFRETGVRVICFLAWLVTLIWAGRRFLLPALLYRPGDIETARRVERLFPGFHDRLASAVDFLKQSEEAPEAGSPAMRRAVIASAAADSDELNFSRVVSHRPARQALAAAAVVLAAWVGAAVADPASTARAIERLAQPWKHAPWPQENQLAFRRTVERLAVGQTFEVEIFDLNENLPEEVRFQYQYDDEETVHEDTLQPLGGVTVARKEEVARPFVYRAVGGDDASMDWTRLEVIEPARVESLKIQLTPPTYTGWPASESPRRIQALRGTRVQMTAKTTKPLQSATLKQENGPDAPARVSADGFGFSIPADEKTPLIVEQSGKYWFELVDRESFPGGADDRWDIRAVKDQPPTPVVIQRPAQDLYVVAGAVLPITVQAEDDLALQKILLRTMRSTQTGEGEEEIVLFAGPKRPPADPQGGVASSPESRDSRRLEYVWRLAPLKLAAGTELMFHATAVDYQPLEGHSASRRLRIITPEQLEERLATSQKAILSELKRLQTLERQGRSDVGGLEKQAAGAGLRKQDVDQLQAAQRSQREVARGLTSETEGAPALIARLLEELRINRLESSETERRMDELSGELTRLGAEDLPKIERSLTAALKEAQAAAGDAAQQNKDVAAALATAGDGQQQVVETLEDMVADLAQWDNYRRFARDIGDVHGEQEDIHAQAAKALAATTGKALQELTPQEATDLKKLAGRQQELARRFDRLQQQMEQMKGQLEPSDPLAAATIEDALDVSRERSLSGKMHEGGAHIDQNQIGQALAEQQNLTEGLAEMLDTLASRREQGLSRLVKKLREAEDELAGLRQAQAGLRKKLKAAAAQPPNEETKRELMRLAREERQLKEQAERLARKLERLEAARAAQTARSAAGQMGQSSQSAEGGSAGEAGEQADQGQSGLDQAQQELAEARRKAERDLAQEQLARLEDELKGLAERQKNSGAAVKEVDAAPRKTGAPDRTRVQRVLDLAQEQRWIERDTTTAAKKVSESRAFNLALTGAAAEMARAAGLLDRQDTGQPAQQAQAAALARLQQLVTALKADDAADGSAGDEGGGAEGIHDLAELRLLKMMQEEINRRTQELYKGVKAAGKVTDAEQRLFNELMEEQGELAGLVAELSPDAAIEEGGVDDEAGEDLESGEDIEAGAADLPDPAAESLDDLLLEGLAE